MRNLGDLCISALCPPALTVTHVVGTAPVEPGEGGRVVALTL